MARRRRSGMLEDTADLVAMLPWWMGVILALLAYVFLSSMAASAPATMVLPGEVDKVVVGTGLRTFATIGQYLVPVVCVMGAAMSAWRRIQRRTLFRDARAGTASHALDRLSWSEFEMLVGEAFRLEGYRVAETGGSGPDGGVDLVLKKGDETFLVQCKQWKALKVGVEVVRQLYGVMAARGATGGFVVTSGRFTNDARRFAEGRNLTLVDGDGLTKLIGCAELAAAAASKVPNAPALAPEMAAAAAGQGRVSLAPSCPLCNAVMVKRTAKRGANARNAFWGCASYPACRGNRPMAGVKQSQHSNQTTRTVLP